ncbi:hypothetical protein B0T17DRAFT_598964 [Bombardia bombarda]|uniref:F-box domain-containing protein n=1 Tax=Bombardia bombarda TaxID=252184 RepID=A0AA40CA75_9PEZI|nr:hypothetical protein B0T17DRAFT_598964 [Bombardia bombarda]
MNLVPLRKGGFRVEHCPLNCFGDFVVPESVASSCSDSSSQTTSHVLQLPTEILLDILTWASLNSHLDRLCLALTCKRLFQASSLIRNRPIRIPTFANHDVLPMLTCEAMHSFLDRVTFFDIRSNFKTPTARDEDGESGDKGGSAVGSHCEGGEQQGQGSRYNKRCLECHFRFINDMLRRDWDHGESDSHAEGGAHVDRDGADDGITNNPS